MGKSNNSLTDEEFKKILDNTQIRSIVVAKIPNYEGENNNHVIRYYLVVGKDDKYFYCSHNTTTDKSEHKNYYKRYDAHSNKYCFFKCYKIYKIGKDEFISNRFILPMEEYKDIINLYVKFCPDLDKIDFKYLNYNINVGRIIMYENEPFVVFDFIKNTNIYRAFRLTPNDDAKLYVYMKGKKHDIVFDDIREIKNTDNYTVLGFAPSKVVDIIRNKDISNYEFGDVLSLKNTSEKVIFLTQIKNMVYYATFDQLDMFTGIYKMENSNIDKLYSKLSDKQLSRLISKIQKPLVNDNYPLYKPAKSSILHNVNVYKKK